MHWKRKNNMARLHFHIAGSILLIALLMCVYNASAQEQRTATIKLDFIKTDSTKTCRATVLSDSSLPVKEKEVHLFVKGLFGELEVVKTVTTDENGVAEFNFPINLPSSNNGMLSLVARIVKDETFGTVETESAVKWGAELKKGEAEWGNRSLSASREKAPMFLVIASTLIICIIWGTIFYVIFQLPKIKKSGKMFAKTQPIIS
ncbi:MAG: hypothetical protein WCI49_10005 [Ferruginibacter sp.]